jgi:nitric oxide reductase subunit B
MWSVLILLTILSFGVVVYIGHKIYIQAPPIPDLVVTNNNQILFTKADINKGQAVWQSIGGQELGTIWGHSAYLAPDWTADWLHREAINILIVALMTNIVQIMKN